MADETTPTTEANPTNNTTSESADPARPTEEGQKAAPDSAQSSVPTDADDASTVKDAPANGSPADKKVEPEKPNPFADIDARLAQVEAALKAEREAKAAAKAEAKPKEAEAKTEPTKAEVRAAAAELAKGGKRAEAALAWLSENGIDVDDDLLLEMAPLLEGKQKRELTDEEKFEQWQAKRDAKARAEAEKQAAEAAAKKAADEAKQREEDEKEWKTYLARGAKELDEGVKGGKYPFISVYGCDDKTFSDLVMAHIKETKQIPKPEEIFVKVENAHKEKWMKVSGVSRPVTTVIEEEVDYDEQVRRSFGEYRSDDPIPTYSTDGEDDPARAMLLQIDRDKTNRRDWR